MWVPESGASDVESHILAGSNGANSAEAGAGQVVVAARGLPRLDDAEVPVLLLDALHGPVTHAPPLIRERLIVLVVLQCHP